MSNTTDIPHMSPLSPPEEFTQQPPGSCLRSSFYFLLDSKSMPYRDSGSFRRIVLRLKRKGKIIANPIRSNPRFYYLAEKLADYGVRNDAM